MAFYDQPRAFVRAEGEEEITPPCKQRSFDSLSVAHILQAKLDPGAGSTSFDPLNMSPSLGAVASLKAPSSPTVGAAAAVLSSVQQHAAHDKAVDCLMSLATMGVQPTHRAPKRKRSSSLSGASQIAAEAPGARRRLPMRSGESNGMHPTVPISAPDTHVSSAAVRIRIPGIEAPVCLQSGATLLQLKLLSAAFKLCPEPSPEQIIAIANRVAVSKEKLEAWFQSRRTLQAWITGQPHLQPADVASMFFSKDDPCFMRTTKQARLHQPVLHS